MNPEHSGETTMNPEKRNTAPGQVDDAVETDDLFTC